MKKNKRDRKWTLESISLLGHWKRNEKKKTVWKKSLGSIVYGQNEMNITHK